MSTTQTRLKIWIIDDRKRWADYNLDWPMQVGSTDPLPDELAVTMHLTASGDWNAVMGSPTENGLREY